jgi:D-arabinitol dehydrogenase (NADP+)
MKAAVYSQPRELSITDIATPQPGPGEVRIRLVRTGVCGTDVHLHDGEFFPVYPLIPGHEIVGRIDSVGAEVTDIGVGQLIALDNMLVCGVCVNCQRARPAFCANLKALGVTNPGGFADYVVAPAGKCHAVDDLDLDTAVLAEPTACAVHGLDILAPAPGSNILLLGAGPTGLILAQLLRASGSGRLTVAAPTQFKLDIATSYGADHTVRIDRGTSLTDTEIPAIAPEGFDIVIDATGSASILGQCLALTRDGGTLFVYGMCPETAAVNWSPYEIFRRELTIKGSFSQAFSFSRALEFLRTGRVRSDGLITHRFPLERYADAIETSRNDRSCIKAVIEFD